MAIDREELKRRVREAFGKERKPEPKRRRVPLKAIVGIFAAILVFALVLAALGRGLGWPSDLPTLGIALGLATIIGGAAGGKIYRSRLPSAAAALLAIGLFTSTLGFGVPWKLRGGVPPSGEEVWFRMDASFTYRGSEENLPIENVVIRFPCPNVENEPLPTYTFWTLYYQENDNTLTLQADQNQVHGFRGERTMTLGILLSGVEPTGDGPRVTYVLDKLYSREVFWIINFTSMSKESAHKVTLRIHGDNEGRSSGAFFKYHPLGPFEKPINVSFWVQLSNKIDDNYQVIETFSRSIDNRVDASPWLYPS